MISRPSGSLHILTHGHLLVLQNIWLTVSPPFRKPFRSGNPPCIQPYNPHLHPVPSWLTFSQVLHLVWAIRMLPPASLTMAGKLGAGGVRRRCMRRLHLTKTCFAREPAVRKGTIIGSDDMGPFLSPRPNCDRECVTLCLCSYLKNGVGEAGDMEAGWSIHSCL